MVHDGWRGRWPYWSASARWPGELRTPHQKLDGDRRLIHQACTPKKGGIAKNIKLWPEFKDHNVADVEVERDIGRKLARGSGCRRANGALWFIDQQINDRGIPIDMDLR